VRNARSLTVIDTTTNDADDIDTGDLPRGLQLSPDGSVARPAHRRRQLNVIPEEL